ncbi:hypothetical protein [Leptolyngbya sp. NIES-2104]|uniref:hypothetical protein n=1 Tax=Leptolyngbya sp. NIES-2104 TaxID=1552121 RepID=UPI0006ECA81D|nr:hypothetical protein [Leptolyngbya sp. NIES-2104]GAQ00113.1 hypothetical protein NIES2104_66780 [Leptolyngbya sp. NIES-2104]
MNTADDRQFQQEQISRAEEIRSILERTFAVAQAKGDVKIDEVGDWRYDGENHSLVYDSQNRAFWIESAERQLNVHWDEQKYNSDLSDIITDEQLLECRELERWLDQQKVPQNIDLSSIQITTAMTEISQAITASFSTAERLFEFYAEQGASAYRSSEESTEQCYRFAVDDAIYIVSRDDTTGEYGIQRENAVLTFTTEDEQTWGEISYWLGVQEMAAQTTFTEDSPDETYWDQQQRRANEVLLIAERALTHQEEIGLVHYVANLESYVVQDVGQYTIGYRSKDDELWIANHNGEVLMTSTDRSASYDEITQSWLIDGLGKSGYLSDRDVLEFQSLDHWLNAKEWTAGQELDRSLVQNLAAANQVERRIAQELLPDVQGSNQRQIESSRQTPTPTDNRIQKNDLQIEM